MLLYNPEYKVQKTGCGTVCYVRILALQKQHSAVRFPHQSHRKTNNIEGSILGVWHSLVVRLVRDQEAAGSNPVTPTNVYSIQRSVLFKQIKGLIFWK